MSKRSIALMSLLIVASVLLSACGGAGGGGGAAGGALKVVSSLPMTGSALTQNQTIVNAMKLRLDRPGAGLRRQVHGHLQLGWRRPPRQWDPAVETKTPTRLPLINRSLPIWAPSTPAQSSPSI
jgi:hypothetical protein